ncbi:MAG: hypothetical protein ACO395_10825 [Pontimonas sp.]
MNTLSNTTDMSVSEIVVLLGADCLNDRPTLGNAPTKSRVAPVAFHDGHPVLVLDAEQRGGDVYDLLDSVTPDDSVNYYALITAGWASPYDGNDHLPPSQHPERKRVELMSVASRDGSVASVIAMAGQPLIIDEGKAQGALADAVKAIFG